MPDPALRGMAGMLSFCMIVKNEERHLARCLDSVLGLAGECIVVDTGSTDATAEIAVGYGAEVVAFDFATVDFAAARNHAIAQARGSWILMLDADETLDPAGVPMIQQLVALGENAGYFFERHNHGGDARSLVIDHAVRLFPNRPEYRYRGRVHETIDAAILAAGGRLRRTGVRIDHNFASDPEARRRKNRWYIEILEQEIAADPGDHSRLEFLAAEYHQLEMFEAAAEVAERLVQARPLDHTAHFSAGVYHMLSNPDPRRARADFERALRLRPGYPEAREFLRFLDERQQAACAESRPALPSIP